MVLGAILLLACLASFSIVVAAVVVGGSKGG